MASSAKLPSAVTTVKTDGQKRVKLSEVLRPAAHATSSKPAISRRNQDIRQLHEKMGPSPLIDRSVRPSLRRAIIAKRASNRADQPVSHPGFGHDMLRLRRAALQLAAQMRHINTQVVMALDVRRSPPVAEQLPGREHAAGVAHERREQPVFDRRQMDRGALAGNLAQ